MKEKLRQIMDNCYIDGGGITIFQVQKAINEIEVFIQEKIADLESINESHRKLNGELRERIKELRVVVNAYDAIKIVDGDFIDDNPELLESK